ncbi:MAG: hypothetical protein JWO06_217 [Bacteroidota bacterium]|nr:hypothetical protein [Bacteroidota bacterium]
MLSSEELLRQVGIICVSCGIKDLPPKPILLLCLKFWNERYASQLNPKELELAFELNLCGEYGNDKVNHYQVFSVEFFCSVLNKYLDKKAQVLSTATKALPETNLLNQPDMKEQLLNDILKDFKTSNTDATVKDEQQVFNISAKLNLLSKIFKIDISESSITELREKARWLLVRQLVAKKTALNNRPNKFGAVTSITHQLTRLKTGKLLTESDEDQLQYEVNRLLYIQTLLQHKPLVPQTTSDCDFVNEIQNFCSNSVRQNV